MVANRGEEFDGCERAVGDQDNMAIGEPTVDLQGGLTRPMEQHLGCPRLVGIEAFGGGEKGEKGNAMMRSAHGIFHQQHGGKPARALALTKCSFNNRRIAIDAASADLGAPAPFDGVVEADHDWGAGRHEGLYQHNKQLARRDPG